MKDIVIIGYGGVAKEVAQYIEDVNTVNNEWNIIGFTSIDKSLVGRRYDRYNIAYADDELINFERELLLIIGSGFPEVIYKIWQKYSVNSYFKYPCIVHPNSYLSKRLDMGIGNIVAPGVVISVDVILDNFNLVSYNATIGHDTKINSFCVINPGCNISGNVSIGSRVLVGTGAQILQGLSICDDVIIGAGAVVTKDITEPGTYVGVPAKLLY